MITKLSKTAGRILRGHLLMLIGIISKIMGYTQLKVVVYLFLLTHQLRRLSMAHSQPLLDFAID